jgi:hypothetical protein
MWLFVGLLALGCSGSESRDIQLDGWIASRLPVWIKDSTTSTHPDYPRDVYICKVGESTEGESAAAKLARAEVSRSIRTSLSAELEFVQMSSEAGSTQSIESKITESTSFSRAELIQSVDSSYEHRGITYRMACLDRHQAIESLESEYRAELQVLRAQLSVAETSHNKNDTKRFIKSYRAINRLVNANKSALLDLAALRGSSDLLKRWRDVKGSATSIRLMSEIGFNLTFESGGDVKVPLGVRETVEANLIQLAGDFDITMASHLSCATGALAELKATTKSQCNWGHRGWTCSLPIRFEVYHCEGSSQMAKTSASARIVTGSHGESKEMAIERINSSRRIKELKTPLAQAFSSVLPIQTESVAKR